LMALRHAHGQLLRRKVSSELNCRVRDIRRQPAAKLRPAPNCGRTAPAAAPMLTLKFFGHFEKQNSPCAGQSANVLTLAFAGDGVCRPDATSDSHKGRHDDRSFVRSLSRWKTWRLHRSGPNRPMARLRTQVRRIVNLICRLQSPRGLFAVSEMHRSRDRSAAD